MGLVGISKKNKTKNVHLLKKMSLFTKLIRRYKQRYAPITPNKCFLILLWIVNVTIQSNFTRISSKPMLISPRHFALTG